MWVEIDWSIFHFALVRLFWLDDSQSGWVIMFERKILILIWRLNCPPLSLCDCFVFPEKNKNRLIRWRAVVDWRHLYSQSSLSRPAVNISVVLGAPSDWLTCKHQPGGTTRTNSSNNTTMKTSLAATLVLSLFCVSEAAKHLKGSWATVSLTSIQRPQQCSGVGGGGWPHWPLCDCNTTS